MESKSHIYHSNKLFKLESGSTLPGFHLKYSILGKLNQEKSNVVWVCHSLTGDLRFDKWWKDLFDEHGPFDPREYCIVSANVLGGCYGSTGPLSINPNTGHPYFYSFPRITNKDVVEAFDLLRKQLGLHQIHTLIGGSLGGQQVLEWAGLRPTLFKFVIPIACNACHSPWGIAINEAQRMAIAADQTWGDENPNAGKRGLRAARAMSMNTFRTYEAFKAQDDPHSVLDDYKASAYQQYQGDKLISRFDAFSFWTLTKMMDSHHLGRGSLSLKAALNRIRAKVLVVGIDSDLLFPISEQQFIHGNILNSELAIIHSIYGHDAFLKETHKLNSIIKNFVTKEFKSIEHA